MTKVAINGFGRIGRLAFRHAFRQMFEAEGYEVVAINDLTSPKMLAHLLKYDTAQGGFAGKFGEGKHTVEATEDSIIVDGKEIKISAEKDAANCPWKANDVDVVLECTGFYTSKEKASAHLAAGAKKVVISAPAGNDLPTIVFNTNHKTLTANDKIISAASCTTNCLAPMADALNKYAAIQSGIMSTIHAYTGDQMILTVLSVRVTSVVHVQVLATSFLTQLVLLRLSVSLSQSSTVSSSVLLSAFQLQQVLQLSSLLLLRVRT